MEATARVTIGLVDRHGKMANKRNSDAYVFLPVHHPREFPKFVRKSKLTSRRYLVDDCLTIRCVLTVIKTRTEVTRAGQAAAAPLPELHGHLQRMLSDGKGTDVTIQVRGQDFRAHRCMLAARSPVFDAELFGERVTIGDMKPMVFELLLHFMYTDSLPDNGEGCSTAVTQHLLVAADRYGMDKLKQVCDMKLRTSLDVESGDCWDDVGAGGTAPVPAAQGCVRDIYVVVLESVGRCPGNRRVQTSHGEHLPGKS